jgi:SAM-dependent methyltransferase
VPHPPDLFDRKARRRARDRAAPGFAHHAFLKEALLDDLVDRLAGFGIDPQRVLDLGAHDGRLAARLPGARVIAADSGFRFARTAGGVTCDEDLLPFADACFDAVVSAASLGGVNDLPGALVQVRRALRPDGIFLGAFVAGTSLAAERARLLDAEAALRGGASPRLHPMVDPRQAPSLLQRAGLADPVVDVAEVTVRYAAPGAALADLRGMGESNVLAARSRTPAGRRLRTALEAAFADARDADGRIAVTLQIVTLTGRRPGVL